MIYTFKCVCHPDAWDQFQRTMAEGPPSLVVCGLCGSEMQRDWKADAPMIDTSACRDHSDIPVRKRVASHFDRGSADQIEAQFKGHIDSRRKQIRDAGGQRGSVKQTHAVPAHLFHGKKKETGDVHYWEDPKNLARHDDCRVDR